MSRDGRERLEVEEHVQRWKRTSRGERACPEMEEHVQVE